MGAFWMLASLQRVWQCYTHCILSKTSRCLGQLWLCCTKYFILIWDVAPSITSSLELWCESKARPRCAESIFHWRQCMHKCLDFNIQWAMLVHVVPGYNPHTDWVCNWRSGCFLGSCGFLEKKFVCSGQLFQRENSEVY